MNIKQKQCLLTFLGYDTGGVDGIWGNKSRHALQRCQEDLGIPADGIWGEQTEAAVLEAVCACPTEELEDTGQNALEVLFRGIRYWKSEEFRCQCGGKYCSGFPALPDRSLLELVDDLRHRAGKPAHRSSGLRCTTWNTLQGGVANSRHMRGKALDFCIEGDSGTQLLAMAQADPRTNYAYIIDGQYVHVDVA